MRFNIGKNSVVSLTQSIGNILELIVNCVGRFAFKYLLYLEINQQEAG